MIIIEKKNSPPWGIEPNTCTVQIKFYTTKTLNQIKGGTQCTVDHTIKLSESYFPNALFTPFN